MAAPPTPTNGWWTSRWSRSRALRAHLDTATIFPLTPALSPAEGERAGVRGLAVALMRCARALLQIPCNLDNAAFVDIL